MKKEVKKMEKCELCDGETKIVKKIGFAPEDFEYEILECLECGFIDYDYEDEKR